MNKMMKHLPWYYRRSKITSDFYDAIQNALDEWSAKIDEADSNLFIMTTSVFDLHELDVDIKQDSTLDDETRRAKVLARLRATPVLTVEALKELVKLFDSEGCDVTELYDEYAFTVDFSRDGVPKNIKEILDEIYELKPAHLRLGLKFTRHPDDDIYVGGFVQQLKEINLEVQNG